ncbi:uncharacterized protein LOC110863545 [Folsomia candida]|uniref:Uncharacterized protein n=1 Tax=Folsomia candida TaxID=158441 RepID=A0A226F1R1_FOLCA|nr:uncharacterized protein LOC110863545 [Folsomia candida]XP_035702346.1 uncharacterized protein LOC110863545 [Folsomia candida]OXA63719.1 hypothetical protein Fcan01_01545 [Folsomia candida]
MGYFKFRWMAKVVAIMDLLLTSLSIWKPILILCSALAATKRSSLGNSLPDNINVEDVVNENTKGLDLEGRNLSAFLLWIAFILSSVFIIFQLIADVRLLRAVHVVFDDAKKASASARFWRNVTTTFTMSTMIVIAFGPNAFNYGFCITSILFHFIGIYIVVQFMKEIETDFGNSCHGQVTRTVTTVGGLSVSGCDNPPSYDQVNSFKV